MWLIKNTLKSKVVLYEKIEMIKAEKRTEFVNDLEKRTGLKIENLEVENIDLLRDTAKIRVFYFE